MSEDITVALVDDDPMVRTGLGYILRGEPGLTVAWQADDGAEALNLLAEQPVDVVLLDIRMPGMDGLATLETLQGRAQRPRVLVLTTFNTDDYVLRALGLGADGFLLKDTDPAELVAAIRRATTGDPILDSDVTRTLIEVATRGGSIDEAARRGVAQLTDREREVAVLMTQGLTNSQIGSRMNISLASVKTHLTAVFIKLGVDNRVSAAMIVRDAGL